MNDFQQNLETQSNDQAMGPGLRVLDPVQVQGQAVYPWAPTTVIQKSGASMVKDEKLIDIDSELMNITRKISNDPNQHYKPDEKKIIEYQHLKEGFFHREDTRLTNPASTYRGMTNNRWIELYKGAQDNVIEPFEFREGYNTHLMLVDTYEPCIEEALQNISPENDEKKVNFLTKN